MPTSNCTSISANCPVEATVYGYYPDLGANAFFAAWFGLFLFAQLLLGIKFKTWAFMSAVALGCLAEMIGYIGRVIMHSNPWSSLGFKMQICCLIVAPAFVSAGIYLTFRSTVLALGTQFSRLRPNYYTWIFISADLASLILQGVGGGIAASASTSAMRNTGSDLMLAGIVGQVVSLLIFAAFTTEYLFRIAKRRQELTSEATAILRSRSFKLFAAGIVVAFITIFTRCIYRIPEMSGGWGNSVMQDQTGFIVLDGVMVSVAVLALTVFHPGACCSQLWVRHDVGQGKQMSLSSSSLEAVERGEAETK